jgi:hypothetical protein
MKIGYNKVVGITLLVFGILNCCLSTVFIRSGEAVPSGIVASFWITFVAGIFFLTRAYIEVTQNEIVVKSLIGFISKRVSFNSVKDFSVEGANIFVVSNGVRQKLGISSWVADKRGWSTMVKWIETGDTSTG